MIQKLQMNRFLWLLIGLLSFFAALIGILNPDIYSKVVDKTNLQTVYAQDIVNLFMALMVILICSFGIDDNGLRKQLIVFSGIGYLCYSYGVFVIERYYNLFYFLYMAIFALSFFTILYGFFNIRRELLPCFRLPKGIRWISVGLLWLTPIIIGAIWVNDLLPLIRTGHKIDFFYATYILDFCFILPLFVILAIQTGKSKGIGLLMTPVMFLMGFNLLVGVIVIEILNLIYHRPNHFVEMMPFILFAAAYLILAIFCLRKLRTT